MPLLDDAVTCIIYLTSNADPDAVRVLLERENFQFDFHSGLSNTWRLVGTAQRTDYERVFGGRLAYYGMTVGGQITGYWRRIEPVIIPQELKDSIRSISP